MTIESLQGRCNSVCELRI